jgi:hypothetical protein
MRGRLVRPSLLVVIACVWFAASFFAIVWTWGLDPVIFPTPDEAQVRQAAGLIGKHQAPFLPVPIVDAEDLFHPRGWLTLGDKAWPSYAPVSIYCYGWLLRAGLIGLVLIVALPASGVAAFSAGVGLLLPPGRRWLALLTPALAFPALFWILRTWVNISPLLIGCSWSLFFWAKWRGTGQSGWFAASMLALGFGAAVRPDYAPYLFVVALLFSVAASPASWRLVLAYVATSGVLAVGANLVLNKVITGHALQAAYQVAVDRQWGPEPDSKIPGLGMLRSLIVPMGLPTLSVLGTAFRKYWLNMGPISLLLFGQLALVPLVLRGSRMSRALKVLGVLAILLFTVSRLQEGLYGAVIATGEVQHSVPRYLTPVYLIAVLPPVLFLGQCERRLVLIPGTVLLVALALTGGYGIVEPGLGSLRFVKEFVREKQVQFDILSRIIPPGAVVYTALDDKWLWSRWRLACIDKDDATATSIGRAMDAQLPVYLFMPPKHLLVALKRRKLGLVRVDARRSVWRMTPR